MNDPTFHAGWHFRIGQDDAPLWWGVAAYVGLALLIEPDAASQVPQIDEWDALEPNESRAFAAASEFVRENVNAIHAAGHRVYAKSASRKPLPGHRDFVMVDPAFLILAYEIARGCMTPTGLFPIFREAEFKRTMRGILVESAEIAAKGPQASL